ncbi:MAG: hypothetical protein AVDCRST_MAG68-743, partial [uncultured Gemmatimonadetes bacterium]
APPSPSSLGEGGRGGEGHHRAPLPFPIPHQASTFQHADGTRRPAITAAGESAL